MSTYIANATNEYAIEIAGISMLAKANGNHFELGTPLAYDKFIDTTNSSDIELIIRYEKPPQLSDCDKLIFDSGFTWKLYESGDSYVFTIDNPISGPGIYRFARFDKGFTRGELFVKPCDLTEERKGLSGKTIIFPFEYPIDELLIINKVADGTGVDIHGCAINYNGSGMLFVGVSGAGKSTLANLWKSKPVEILSDDRLIVKPDGDRFRVYGTPWHGDAKVSSATSVPLNAIYFIAKSSENWLRRLSSIEVATRLLVCCFPTFYFKEGMAKTVALLEEIARTVPAYEFGFLPEQSAIDFLIAETDG